MDEQEDARRQTPAQEHDVGTALPAVASLLDDVLSAAALRAFALYCQGLQTSHPHSAVSTCRLWQLHLPRDPGLFRARWQPTCDRSNVERSLHLQWILRSVP